MKSRAHPIYEARTKVSEILRRVTAAASVTTFFLVSVTTFLLASSGSSFGQPLLGNRENSRFETLTDWFVTNLEAREIRS
jgi:hypothetical protein